MDTVDMLGPTLLAGALLAVVGVLLDQLGLIPRPRPRRPPSDREVDARVEAESHRLEADDLLEQADAHRSRTELLRAEAARRAAERREHLEGVEDLVEESRRRDQARVERRGS